MPEISEGASRRRAKQFMADLKDAISAVRNHEPFTAESPKGADVGWVMWHTAKGDELTGEIALACRKDPRALGIFTRAAQKAGHTIKREVPNRNILTIKPKLD